MARSRDGFTLIEVLAALLIVSLVFGLLLESVTSNLADLGRARLEARTSRIAEQRARDLEAEIGFGTPLEDGESEGECDPPDEDLRWHQNVTAQVLLLPEDYLGATSPSPLFARPGESPAPIAGPTPAPPPPLRLIEVRVFAADAAPESAEPYVLLVTAPPDPARLAQLQQQAEQAITTPNTVAPSVPR